MEFPSPPVLAVVGCTGKTLPGRLRGFTNVQYDSEEVVSEMLTQLGRIALADISKGSVLARLLGPLPVWAGIVPIPNDPESERARAYSDLRLSGLLEILSPHVNSGLQEPCAVCLESGTELSLFIL